LIQIRREHASADNPETTAVAPADDWKSGKNADEQSAEQRRLEHGVTLPYRSLVLRLSS
jgi:hypothetical protein